MFLKVSTRPRLLISLMSAILFSVFAFTNDSMDIFSCLEKILLSYNLYQWLFIYKFEIEIIHLVVKIH